MKVSDQIWQVKPILILLILYVDNKIESKSKNLFDPDVLKGFNLDDIPDEGEWQVWHQNLY